MRCKTPKTFATKNGEACRLIIEEKQIQNTCKNTINYAR